MAVDANEVQAPGQDVAADQVQDASQQPQEPKSGGIGDFLRRTFFGGGQEDAAEADGAGASEGDGETSRDGSATDQPSPDGETITLSRAEYRQRVQQSARDMLAAQQRQNETRAQRAERLRLAREEPYKLADQVEQELTAQEHAESYQAQFVQSLAPVLQIVDAEVVGAVVQAMPDDARQKLFAEMPADLTGIAQRKAIVAGGLQALERHWKSQGAAEATAKLERSNVYQKAYTAGQRDAEEEPDLIPAAGVPRRADMDSFLRGMLA